MEIHVNIVVEDELSRNEEFSKVRIAGPKRAVRHLLQRELIQQEILPIPVPENSKSAT